MVLQFIGASGKGRDLTGIAAAVSGSSMAHGATFRVDPVSTTSIQHSAVTPAMAPELKI